VSIIEVNLAGFQFTRGVPEVPAGAGRRGWHVSLVHRVPRLHMRWRAARLRAA